MFSRDARISVATQTQTLMETGVSSKIVSAKAPIGAIASLSDQELARMVPLQFASTRPIGRTAKAMIAPRMTSSFGATRLVILVLDGMRNGATSKPSAAWKGSQLRTLAALAGVVQFQSAKWKAKLRGISSSASALLHCLHLSWEEPRVTTGTTTTRSCTQLLGKSTCEATPWENNPSWRPQRKSRSFSHCL